MLPGLELRGNALLAAGSIVPLALYQSGAWRRGNISYSVVECNPLIVLHLEDGHHRAPMVIGPRHCARLRGTRLFAGREVVAKLSEGSQRWLRPGAQESWEVVRIVPASPDPAS
jgi:hypothetical protein